MYINTKCFILICPTYHSPLGDSVPYKSAPVNMIDRVSAITQPNTHARRVYFDKGIGISSVTPLSAMQSPQDISLLVPIDKIDYPFLAKKDSIAGDTLGKLNVIAYPKRTRKLGIIYVNEENDDVQIVPRNTNTTSDTTVCIRWGRNKFLDTKVDPRDSVMYDVMNRDSVIVAGSDKVCNTVANNSNVITTQPPGTLIDLKRFLNTVYNPANIEFTVVDTVGTVNINFDLNKDGKFNQDNKEKDTAIKNLSNKFRSNTNYDYYVFLIDNPLKYNLLGKGYGLGNTDPGIFRFVLVCPNTHAGNATSYYNTVAHELGHGVFNLRHPFDEFSPQYIKGKDPDNFMDYQDGDRSRKYQWDYIHANDKIQSGY